MAKIDIIMNDIMLGKRPFNEEAEKELLACGGIIVIPISKKDLSGMEVDDNGQK